jgi:hypothetical protein
MMQSYASAAKLLGGGPILHSGLEAMVLASGYRHLGSSSANPSRVAKLVVLLSSLFSVLPLMTPNVRRRPSELRPW